MKVIKVFFYSLFGEVLNLVDFIFVFPIVYEGSIEESSTNTDCGYVSFFKDIFRGGCIFVSEVESWFYLINFRVFLGPSFFILFQYFRLLSQAFATNAVFVVIIYEIDTRVALEASHCSSAHCFHV